MLGLVGGTIEEFSPRVRPPKKHVYRNPSVDKLNKLDSVKRNVHERKEASGFATAKEAAEFLRISRTHLHTLVQRGQIPHRRYGQLVRIPWAWLHEQAKTKP